MKWKCTSYTMIWALLALYVLCLQSCYEAEELQAEANFSYTVVNNDYSAPVLVHFTNLSRGGEYYEWTFEGGNPSSSTAFSPGQVQYVEGGSFTVTLKVSNDDGSVDIHTEVIELVSSLSANFEAEVLINNYSPVEVALSNLSENATSYQWTFEGGNPASSTEQHPQNIVFTTEGEHLISLTTTNEHGDSETDTATIWVDPPLDTHFSYSYDLIDDDFQVPFTVYTHNSTESATSYQWSAPGATIESSTEANPTFTYLNPGTYTLSLTATNQKDTQTVSETFTLYPDTNLSIQEDIILGINTAHNSLGAFYSTTTRQVYTASEVDASNGGAIDIVFYGFNSSFNNNKFISPDQTQNYPLSTIPMAAHTLYINKIESCNCGINISPSQFDAMTDDTAIENLNINAQDVYFDDTLVPRIVPFQTQDGRKGLIKLKEFVEQGQESYIIIDIKVQKV